MPLSRAAKQIKLNMGTARSLASGHSTARICAYVGLTPCRESVSEHRGLHSRLCPDVHFSSIVRKRPPAKVEGLGGVLAYVRVGQKLMGEYRGQTRFYINKKLSGGCAREPVQVFLNSRRIKRRFQIRRQLRRSGGALSVVGFGVRAHGVRNLTGNGVHTRAARPAD